MMDRNRKTLAAACATALKESQKELDKFQERFATNPSFAFQWAPLAAAASMGPLLSVQDACEAELDEGETEEVAYERIRAYIEDMAMRYADRIERSTSQTSNQLVDYERAMWVRMMKFANGHVLVSSL